MGNKRNKIAVVICTHDRKKYLLEAVISFRRIKEPKFDIVVIDSSSESLKRNERKGIDCYIYDKSKKPLSAKRNLAIRNVKTEIIAFTDDDCVATKSWIYEITRAFEDKEVACVTGRTITAKSFKDTVYEKIFSFDNLGRKKKTIIEHFGLQNLWRFGHGNNMAFQREIFGDVGLFDEKLGVGSEGKAGEDVDMFYRIYKAGYKIVFNPNAVILHKHIAKEENLSSLARNNTYASHIVLWKHHDLNTLAIFFAGIFKLGLDVIFAASSGDKRTANVKLQSLLGWLGARWKE